MAHGARKRSMIGLTRAQRGAERERETREPADVERRLRQPVDRRYYRRVADEAGAAGYEDQARAVERELLSPEEESDDGRP